MEIGFAVASLVGWWVAEDDKAVLIGSTGSGALLVSVHPGRDAEPYRSAELLGGGTKRIDRLVATPQSEDGLRCLQIEAGTDALGPTYRLYPVEHADDGWRAVEVTSELSAPTALLPNVRIGLYDDYEDDLGAPWAYPLLPLMRAERR